ncbi:MAG: hypothetical protein ACRD72_20420 [Candidatus Angelobacter sp.]
MEKRLTELEKAVEQLRREIAQLTRMMASARPPHMIDLERR